MPLKSIVYCISTCRIHAYVVLVGNFRDVQDRSSAAAAAASINQSITCAVANALTSRWTRINHDVQTPDSVYFYPVASPYPSARFFGRKVIRLQAGQCRSAAVLALYDRQYCGMTDWTDDTQVSSSRHERPVLLWLWANMGGTLQGAIHQPCVDPASF